MSVYKNFKSNKVTGIGSALLDFLIHVDDNFIKSIGVKKGGMTLVNIDIIKKLLDEFSDVPVIVPGGAACNTIVGISHLGSSARFIGKLGNDSNGKIFEETLIKRNIEPYLLKSNLPTGRVLSIITPDKQRTMLTYLGASSEISFIDISPEYFKGSKIVHVEGYLLFNPELIFSVLKCAKLSGALISLDLASFTVVDENIKILNKLIPKYVDILIGNEDEVFTYTGSKDEKLSLKIMSKNVSIAAIKLGSRGSYISVYGNIFKIPPFLVEDVIDTTGAGDLWASGLLFGLANDFTIEESAKIASMCGAEVCKVIGANIPNLSWLKINKMVSEL